MSLTLYVWWELLYTYEIRLFVIGGAELEFTKENHIGRPHCIDIVCNLLPLNQIVQYVKQVAYTDDLTEAGKIRFQKMWWDLLSQIGLRIE